MSDSEDLLGEVLGEILDARGRGESPSRDDYLERYPALADDIRQFFECDDFVESALVPGGIPNLPDMADGAPRIDLKAFPILRRLPDIGMGTVYLLTTNPGETRRELIVFRGWFTPSERVRLEKAVRYNARLKLSRFLEIIQIGRLNRIPYVVREHHRGPSLAEVVNALAAGRGETRIGDSLSDWERGRDLGTVPVRLADDERSRAVRRLLGDRPHMSEVLELFAGFAEQLDLAHRQGIVHRGITPTDLLLTPEGEGRIQGLGLAWCGSGIEPRRMRFWQPAFLAPEVCDDSWGPVTHLVDVYGLGASLAAVVTLENPFGDDEYDAVVKSIGAGVGGARVARLASKVGGELGRLLKSCCENEPARRPPRLAVVAGRLREIAGAAKGVAQGPS